MTPVMTMRSLVLIVPILLSSCAHSWKVIRQAEPNPFVEAAGYQLSPLKFEAASGLDAAERASYAKDEQNMIELFGAAFQSGLGSAAKAETKGRVVYVEAAVTKIGFSHSWLTKLKNVGSTVVKIRVRLKGPNHAVLDEFEIQALETAPGTGPSSASLGLFGLLVDAAAGKSFSRGGRLRSCASSLGSRVAEYVLWRKGGGSTDMKKARAKM